MKDLAFTGTYAAILRDYVAGGGEAALARAYELGRRAVVEGAGVLDLAMVHHEALRDLPALGACGRPAVILAGELFAEALSPFEITLRAYQANARLLGLSETLEKQNGEIERARAQLHMILDATNAIIYLKDADGRFLFVNRAWQDVFGVRRDQVIGHRDDDVLPVEIARSLHGDDREALAAGVPRELEEVIPAHDGSRTYLSLKFPLLDEAGRGYALCCVATDITQRKHADLALRIAKDATEAANRELEAFSYSVAHDLRAPLRTIDGFSRVLLEDHEAQLDDAGKRYLAAISRSAHHMAQLIEGLLGLSRVTRSELNRCRVDLSALARGVVSRLQLADPARQVELVISADVIGQGDARLLAAVLENLLGNAWKFTARCARARIELGETCAAEGTVVFVRDNGAGFDMTYVGRLFGVFQRLHAADEFEGTGIGLATVDRIIRRHGGRIWAEAMVDHGATFYFTLGDPPR